MKTELMNIKFIPNEKEIISILGDDGYRYYNILSKSIILSLNPDIEIWDDAGRRGKYLHGFRMNSLNILIDLYLDSNNSKCQLNCEFKFKKKTLNKIIKQKNSFSKLTQDNIDSAIVAMEKYGGFYLNFSINKESIIDVLYIITIVS